MSESEEIDNPIDEPEEKEAFFAGFIKGFKRINLRKVPEDHRDQADSYILGYALGFLVKLGIVGAIAYGLLPPEVGAAL